MKKKLKIIIILTQVILAIVAFVSWIAILAAPAGGQVDFRKRGNIIGVCNPATNLICEKSVLQDSRGNLYVKGLGGDHVIQKFNQDGKYICSFMFDERDYPVYFLDEEDRLYIYVDYETKGVILQYENNQLIAKTRLSEEENKEMQAYDQDTEGEFLFWTVHMDNGQTIHLEKSFQVL
ncbi:MAG: hypothetical protein MR966_04725 [Lachnospiraceae bacterium]|nr:hypothetical protein [Lachnospiraceae bacterium]